MNDVELTDREEDRLRDLLQRVGAEVPVELPIRSPFLSPTGPSLDDAVVPPEPRRRRRWWIPAIGVAAVAALVVAGARVASDDDSEVVATPDEGAIELPGDGIWRLPPDDGRFTVVHVGRIDMASGFRIAVDDVVEPSRWFAVMAAGFPGLAASSTVASTELPGGGTARRIALGVPGATRLTGSTWWEIDGPQDEWAVTLATHGLDDEQVFSWARELSTKIGFVEGSDTRGRLAVATYELPPPQGLGPLYPPVDRTDGSSITLKGSTFSATAGAAPTDPVLDVLISDLGQRSPVTVLERRLLMESQLFMPQGSRVQRLVDLNQLGPGAFAAEGPGQIALFLFDDDGTVVIVTDGADPSEPNRRLASMDELVELARSLRAMSEDEFRRELERRGVEGVDGDVGPTTTTIAPPAGD